MAVDPDVLSSLAAEYTQAMTSIRGRRVMRLLRREFSGADRVWMARLGDGALAVLGIAARGAALCATDGSGKSASVFAWAHGAVDATQTRFDLLKDSLPVLCASVVRSDECAALREAQRVVAQARPAPA